jgi:CRISPR-associated protein Cas5d
VERVSYPVITPSAARGLLEAVLWKPAIQWHIECIKVLSSIRFVAFRRNEVNNKAKSPTRAIIQNGGSVPLYFIEDDRAQRNTVALRDVDYIVEAHFTFTGRKGSDDNMNKFVDMFNRRVAKGQHFHQPYFGCREFVADILPPDNAPLPISDSRDLGLMLWDIMYQKGKNLPVFFPAKLESGVLKVPSNPGKEGAS